MGRNFSPYLYQDRLMMVAHLFRSSKGQVWCFRYHLKLVYWKIWIQKLDAIDYIFIYLVPLILILYQFSPLVLRMAFQFKHLLESNLHSIYKFQNFVVCILVYLIPWADYYVKIISVVTNHDLAICRILANLSKL